MAILEVSNLKKIYTTRFGVRLKNFLCRGRSISLSGEQSWGESTQERRHF